MILGISGKVEDRNSCHLASGAPFQCPVGMQHSCAPGFEQGTISPWSPPHKLHNVGLRRDGINLRSVEGMGSLQGLQRSNNKEPGAGMEEAGKVQEIAPKSQDI